MAVRTAVYLSATNTTILFNSDGRAGDAEDWPQGGGIVTFPKHDRDQPAELIRYARREGSWLFEVTRGYNASPARQHLPNTLLRLSTATTRAYWEQAERASTVLRQVQTWTPLGISDRCEREREHEGRHHITSARSRLIPKYTLAEEPSDPFRRPRKR